MSVGIHSLPPGTVKALAGAVDGSTPIDPKLLDAARQFEEVFVRQMLKSARIAGDDSDSGYGSMVVDSLAKSISSGDGLGLAQRIEGMLRNMSRGVAASDGPSVAMNVGGAAGASQLRQPRDE